MRYLVQVIIIMLSSLSGISAQVVSCGVQLGVGMSDTYYRGNTSFQSSGVIYNASELYDPRRSLSGSMSLEIRFKNPFAWMLNTGFITKGYKVNEFSAQNFDVNYLSFQTSTSFRYYFLQQFHASAYYELSRIHRAVYNDGRQAVNLVELGLYGDQFDHSVGLGLGYRLTDKVDLGFKYIRGLSYVDSLLLSDSNGNESRNLNEYSQYGQIFFTYNFYVSTRKEDLGDK